MIHVSLSPDAYFSKYPPMHWIFKPFILPINWRHSKKTEQKLQAKAVGEQKMKSKDFILLILPVFFWKFPCVLDNDTRIQLDYDSC